MRYIAGKLSLYLFTSETCTLHIITLHYLLDLLPAEVQNLRSTMDYSAGFLILEWDKPMNCETVQDVTAYDVRFKPCTSLERKDYHMMTVKATARNIVLTRESGLRPLKNYEFEVRARNAGYEGNWSGILEHIGMFLCVCLIDLKPLQKLFFCL